MAIIADGFSAYLDGFGKGIEPDPDMWIDEWADAHMVIPKKSGAAHPGPYRTDRTPYAREVMRCLSPLHPCRRVVVMGASQLMKTQVGLNWVAGSIHQAPANVLTLLPTLNIAKRVSSRIGDVIRAVPVLKERVAEPRSRDSKNTIDTKEFDGGTLYITTAGSASNLAEIPARYIWGDEVDRWETNVDGEGDPVELAEARASTFEFNAKIYFSSSPTIEGTSRIDTLFKSGDQRRFYIACPHCQHEHILEWENCRWDAEVTEAWFACPECGSEILEHEKPHMLAAGRWIAAARNDGRTVSFHFPAQYAPLGWLSWLSMARQYVKAKAALDQGDQGPMQVFYNTRLARCWNPSEETAKADQLKLRAEPYLLRTLPRQVLVLTAAADVQGNRIEVDIYGWGESMERWVIDHQILWGSPSEDAVWRDLDGVLRGTLLHPSGTPLPISAALIDTGGHHAQEVYNYCRTRRNRNVLAIKGASRPSQPIISTRPRKQDINYRGRAERLGVELWLIGTDTAKDWLASRWLLTGGPGAIHFSVDLPDEFYSQLTSERRLVRYRNGHKISDWVKNKADRNEALDLAVYNLAAAYYLGLHRKRDHDWAVLSAKLDPPTRDLFAAAPAPAPDSSTPALVPPLAIPPITRLPTPRLQPADHGFGSDGWNL